jgi:hypothetical protein
LLATPPNAITLQGGIIMKRLIVFTTIVVALLFQSACTAVSAKTEVTAPAATATASPVPSITPKPSPSPVPTATTAPTADAKAMIAWRDVGLPGNFKMVAPENLGIQPGEQGFKLLNGKTYPIEQSFLFVDSDSPTQLVYGYTALLPTTEDQNGFDEVFIQSPAEFLIAVLNIPISSVVPLDNAHFIGDKSAGASAWTKDWRYTLVSFRIGEVAAQVYVRSRPDIKVPVNAQNIARVYAKSLQQPAAYCKIVSAKPVEDAPVATFSFEADGFYPREGRYIKLEGPFLVGDVTNTSVVTWLGQTGEAADKEGRILEKVSFSTLDELSQRGFSNPTFASGPTEFTLTVGGYVSGCEVSEKVTWPGKP